MYIAIVNKRFVYMLNCYIIKYDLPTEYLALFQFAFARKKSSKDTKVVQCLHLLVMSKTAIFKSAKMKTLKTARSSGRQPSS